MSQARSARDAPATARALGVLGAEGVTVEARKLEHHYPRALKVKYRESQQETSKINVPTF